MQVGFIGLGSMGSGMAANLLKAGHALTVYNRTPAKAEALVAEGGRLAKTPREAARGDVVITMLADDAAVESVAFGRDGVLAGLKLSLHEHDQRRARRAARERASGCEATLRGGTGVRPP